MSISDNDECTRQYPRLLINHLDGTTTEIEFEVDAESWSVKPDALVIYYHNEVRTFFPMVNVRSYTIIPSARPFEELFAEMVETVRPDLDT